MDLDVPRFLDSQPRLENPAAKPGRALPSTRFSVLPSHIPASVRWTRYGCWDDQGLTVFNDRGHVIYEAGKVSFTRRGPDTAPPRRSIALVWRS